MTTAANVSGAIQKVANDKPAKTKTAADIMKQIVNHDETQKILKNSLKENAGAFTASVIDLYNSDKYLQKCDPKKVMGECLKAVSLKLPINKQLGFAYVVPYNNEPQFQIGYKGYIQLCMRSGAYRFLNAGPVYEGEFKKYDKLTSELDIGGEPASDTIVGYFAFIETNNGFKKSLYWTKDQVVKHAKRYSKSYGNSSSAWVTNFDEMATKTVLRFLLSHYGLMSIELINALSAENSEYADDLLTEDTDPTADDKDILEAEFSEVTEDESQV